MEDGPEVQLVAVLLLRKPAGSPGKVADVAAAVLKGLDAPLLCARPLTQSRQLPAQSSESLGPPPVKISLNHPRP